MLAHLLQKVITTLASVSTITVSTYGPAGIQAGAFPCEAEGIHLFVLIPNTSELLFNLEKNADVVVTTPEWHLHGSAAIIIPPVRAKVEQNLLRLRNHLDNEWCDLVKIHPARLHIHPLESTQSEETIDIVETSAGNT